MATWGLVHFLSCCSAGSAGEFPYVAYVIEPDTYVRSGPGNQHYPTGQLPAGFAVEVYRHDGEGWCAIRPPDGSFSLAPSHQVRIIDQHTAEVTASGVVARVGSSVADGRNAVQVLLERGEVVQLVAPSQPNDAWVKIAPPAGEFRWIAARRLSRTPPVESRGLVASSSPSPPSPAKGVIVDPADGFGHLLQAPASFPTPTAPATNDLNWQSKSFAIGAPGAKNATGVEQLNIVQGSPASVELAEHQERVAATTAQNEQVQTAGQPRIRFEGLSSTASLDDRVAELQLRLSQIVVQSPMNWQLGGLREEASAALAQEESPEMRERLRSLLDRIVAFESVQTRARSGPAALTTTTAAPSLAASPLTQAGMAMTLATQPAEPRGLTGNSANVLARVRSDLGVNDGVEPTPGTTPPADPIASAAPVTDAQYDAVGTLKPVVSRRQQAPRFALIDDHGDVVTFVTAAADVNLQPYIGQRIGVRGSRGFMPEYRRAHVTASRITPLEEKLIK